MQYDSLNVKLSISQLNKLKSAIKNKTDLVLRLSSNMIGDNERNFPHKLLLTNRQVANFRKAFANNSSTVSKTQLSRVIQSGLKLMKNIMKPLTKSVLIRLGLTSRILVEDSGLLLKGVTETVQNEVKVQKGGFLSMLLATLGGSLLGNYLTGKGINTAGKVQGINRAVEGVLRAGYGNSSSKMNF